MWARNASVNVGCECSCRTISSLSTNVTLHAVTAVAVVIRRGWPPRQPSPKNAPWSMTATMRCAPARDRNDSRTVPFCTYITLVAGGRCEKVACPRARQERQPHGTVLHIHNARGGLALREDRSPCRVLDASCRHASPIDNRGRSGE